MKKLLTVALMLVGGVAQAQPISLPARVEIVGAPLTVTVRQPEIDFGRLAEGTPMFYLSPEHPAAGRAAEIEVVGEAGVQVVMQPVKRRIMLRQQGGKALIPLDVEVAASSCRDGSAPGGALRMDRPAGLRLDEECRLYRVGGRIDTRSAAQGVYEGRVEVLISAM